MTRRWVVLLSLAAALLFGIPAFARQTISLDGDWECVYGDVNSPPAANVAWEPITVPSALTWRTDGPHTLWYRRIFYLPTGWAGQRIILILSSVKFSQRVLLNGKEIGQHVGGFGPVEYDLTNQAILSAANELLVAAQDWTSLIAPGAKVGAQDPGRDFGSWVTDGLIAPLGAQGWEVGISGSVTLEARPRVWIAGVHAAPSVRQQMLRVHVTLKNASVTPERTIVTARIATGGGGPRFSPQLVATAAGEEKTVTMEASWPDAHLWSPEDPHLYSVVIGARTAAAGDSLEVRFGFREFWAEGDRFLLNGAPISLLATAALPLPDYDSDPADAYDAATATGCVAMALVGEPWPEQWYDAADEYGMLLISESALWRLGPSYALGKDEFWKNAQEQVVAQVKAQRNHPSIIIWAADNELLYSGGAATKGAEQKLAAFADAVRKTDPTRPVMFEGDADPAAKADIVNLHYPHEIPRWSLWPQTAYWFDSPVPLDNYPGAEWQWDRKKPLHLGAFGWVPAGDVNSASVLLGDAAYPDADTARNRAEASVWEAQISSARDAGVSGISPWSMWEVTNLPSPQSEAQTRAYGIVVASVREAGARAFAGTVVDRTAMVSSDSPYPRSLDLRWRLAASDGEWEVKGHAPVTLAAAASQRLQASLALPPLDVGVTPAIFSLELWDGDQETFASSQAWNVYGRAPLSGPIAGAPARVAIYDPSGKTTSLLSGLGIDCLALDAENAVRYLHFMPLAVIGKGAFSATPPADPRLLSALAEFVRAGGTLLVFEQTAYPANLIPASLTDHESSIAFPRFVEHPALAGVDAGDLFGWLTDGVVARKEVLKLTKVGFLPIVDSGSDRGLATAGLAELRLGKGRFLLCQLDVTAKADVDPVATRIFRNLLACAASPPPLPGATGVFADDAAAAVLDSIGLEYDRLKWPLAKGALRKYAVLLICDPSSIAEPARIQEFVGEGGQAVLHRVTPDTLGLIQPLTGQAFALAELTNGAVALSNRTGPAAALSNQELAWFEPSSPTGAASPALSLDIASYTLRQGREAIVPIKPVPAAPTYHTLPAVLVSTPLRRGQFILDQVRWEQAGPNQDKARRYLATLLTNLGCAAK